MSVFNEQKYHLKDKSSYFSFDSEVYRPSFTHLSSCSFCGRCTIHILEADVKVGESLLRITVNNYVDYVVESSSGTFGSPLAGVSCHPYVLILIFEQFDLVTKITTKMKRILKLGCLLVASGRNRFSFFGRLLRLLY